MTEFMDVWSSALVSLLLLTCAAGLMVSHVRTWRAAQTLAPECRELDYRRSQFRRRMQTSAMLGLLAIAIFVGQILQGWIGSATFAVLYWGGVLVLLAWIGLLALADVLATKVHYGRLRSEFQVEHAKLQAELRRIQSSRQNGHARSARLFGDSPAKDEE
jgi:hypothetical protein